MLAHGIQLLPQGFLQATSPPHTLREEEGRQDPQLDKSNILLLGPTGSGELS